MLEVESKTEDQGKLQLPTIELIPIKEEVIIERQELKLPLLKGASAPNIQQRAARHSIEEVELKLKRILEEAVSEPIQAVESDVDEEFQRKIVENKKLIKLQKLKKEGEHSQPILPKKVKAQLKVKMDNRYERRMKQYRGTEVENKYLQKKKDQMKKDEDKEKQRATSQNKMNRQSSMQSLRRQSMNEKEVKPIQGYSTKLLLRGGRTSQLLFDQIQNYLQNPIAKENKVCRVLPALSKADLQLKLRCCEKKLQGLGMGDSDVRRSNFASLTISEWKKVSVLNGQMNQHISSFDKEIERVNAYLQRNQTSLARYQQNQGMLIEMQFIQDKSMKEQQGTSKQ